MRAANKAPTAASKAAPLPAKLASLLREARWLLLVAVSMYVLLVLFTFDRADPDLLARQQAAEMSSRKLLARVRAKFVNARIEGSVGAHHRIDGESPGGDRGQDRGGADAAQR